MLPPYFDHLFQNNLVSVNFTKCTRSYPNSIPHFVDLFIYLFESDTKSIENITLEPMN